MDWRLRGWSTFWLITLLAAGGCDGTAPDPGARDEIVYHALDEDNDRDLFAVTVDGARSRAVRVIPGRISILPSRPTARASLS